MPEFSAVRIVIPTGQVIECPTCKMQSKCYTDVTEQMLPAFLECSFCMYKLEVRRNSVWPKLHPPLYPVDRAWKVIAKDTDTEEVSLLPQESKPENPGPAKEPDRSELPRYTVLANQLKEITVASVELLATMEEELRAFGKDMYESLRLACGYAEFLDRYFREDYLDDFLREPFTVTRLSLANAEASFGTRLVLSPKFFGGNLGIPLSVDGGMRIELVTSYTRISKSLTQDLSDIIGLPEIPKLFVKGNKIVGQDLHKVYTEIPGIIDDVDSTLGSPSVVMVSHLARNWLGSRAIPPYSPAPVHLNTKPIRHLEIAEPLPEYAVPWKKLESCGRVGVWWTDVTLSRSFCSFVMRRVRGAKAVIHCSDPALAHWKSVGEFSGAGKSGLMDEWYSVLELDLSKHGLVQADIDSALECSMIVIDLCNIDWLNKELRDNVMKVLVSAHKSERTGPLIVLGNDPVMDMEELAEIYSTAHSLTGGYECYDNYDEEINPHYEPVTLSKFVYGLRHLRRSSRYESK